MPESMHHKLLWPSRCVHFCSSLKLPDCRKPRPQKHVSAYICTPNWTSHIIGTIRTCLQIRQYDNIPIGGHTLSLQSAAAAILKGTRRCPHRPAEWHCSKHAPAGLMTDPAHRDFSALPAAKRPYYRGCVCESTHTDTCIMHRMPMKQDIATYTCI